MPDSNVFERLPIVPPAAFSTQAYSIPYKPIHPVFDVGMECITLTASEDFTGSFSLYVNK